MTALVQAVSNTPARSAKIISRNTLIDSLRERHRFILDKVALVEGQREVTYGTFWERIAHYGELLKEQRVAAGHVIGIMCPMSSLDVAALVLATMDIGAVPMVINLTDKFQRVDPGDIGVFGFVMHERTRRLFQAKHPPQQVSALDQGLNWYQITSP
ncbi:MAG: AMP-binding protein, partial [Bacteroidota bacterium]